MRTCTALPHPQRSTFTVRRFVGCTIRSFFSSSGHILFSIDVFFVGPTRLSLTTISELLFVFSIYFFIVRVTFSFARKLCVLVCMLRCHIGRHVAVTAISLTKQRRTQLDDCALLVGTAANAQRPCQQVYVTFELESTAWQRCQ